MALHALPGRAGNYEVPRLSRNDRVVLLSVDGAGVRTAGECKLMTEIDEETGHEYLTDEEIADMEMDEFSEENQDSEDYEEMGY
mgnify:CR=1 FL=1